MLPRLDPDDEDCCNEDEARARDHRVIGEFIPGESAPVDTAELGTWPCFIDPARNVQVELDVQPLLGKPNRLVWLQFLLDSKLKETRFSMLNLYEIPDEIEQGQKMTERQIYDSTKVEPSLPHQKGYVSASYCHNGYLFNLRADRRYMVVATTATPERSGEPCKFMIRTIGPRLSLKHV